MRPGDQTGDIGHHKRAVGPDLNQPQMRVNRGERIGADFRTGPRDAGKQRALPGVGLADEADVGDHLQFQAKLARLAWITGGGGARGTVGGRLEANIPLSPGPAAGGDHRCPFGREILEENLVDRVEDHRPNGDFDGQRFSRGPLAARASPLLADAGAPCAAGGQMKQCSGIAVGGDDHIAAAPPVTAVRTAARNVLLAPKTDAAVSTLPGLNLYLNLVNKHYFSPSSRQKTSVSRCPNAKHSQSQKNGRTYLLGTPIYTLTSFSKAVPPRKRKIRMRVRNLGFFTAGPPQDSDLRQPR